MSTGYVKQFVDYSEGTGGDSGANDPTAIQPVLNGVDAVAGADPNVGYGGPYNRPAENLRQRTEALRGIGDDSLYLRDADRGLVIAGPGKVTWPGSTTAGHSGIPTIDDTLYVLPLLTPGYAQTPPVPPVASAFGSLTLLKDDSSPGITVVSRRRSYEGGDKISVVVVPGDALAAAVSDTPARTITVTAPIGTALSSVITALNGLTADSPPAQLVTATLAGGALGADLLLVGQDKQYVSGNYDGEGHAIEPAALAAFFAGNPGSALAEGDTLCIQYAMMVEDGGTGGRRQSIPENSNTALASGSFFNSRVDPSKLVNAIPICKVVNGALVFLNGFSVGLGASLTPGAMAASAIQYAGGDPWTDGATNPATTVEGQLDKIVDDLTTTTANHSGADKIAIDAQVFSFGSRSAESIKARINAVASAKIDYGDFFLGPDAFYVYDQIGAFDDGLRIATLGGPGGKYVTTLLTGVLTGYAQLPVAVGQKVTGWKLYVYQAAGNSIDWLQLCAASLLNGSASAIGSSPATQGGTGYTSFSETVSHVVGADEVIFLYFRSHTVGDLFFTLKYTIAPGTTP